MDQDLSFYLSFMGFSIGILALICALVLLFGSSGARKILGWTFGLLILGTVVTVGVMWANQARQEQLAKARQEQLAHEQAMAEQERKVRELEKAASITWSKEQADDWYRRNGQTRGLSDAQVGLTNNQPTCFSGLQRVPCPPPPGFVVDQPAQTATAQPYVVPAPKSKPGMFDDLIPNAAPKSSSISKPVGPPAAPTGLYEQLIAEEDQRIAWTNSRTPIKLDGPIKLTHASRLERLETIEYEVAFPADKWTDDHRADLTRITTNENCDNRETRKMLDAGFRIKHVFRDQGGILGYSITITKYSCSQVSN
jgi:hypothetical protein